MGDGVADVDVLQGRMTVADAAGHAVHRQLREPALAARHGFDVGIVLQLFEARRRDQVGGIDLAFLQRRHHRVRVGEDAEHDPVDGRSALPVVGVGDHRPRLAGLPLLQREGPGPDAVESVVGVDLTLRRRLPDVPGQDVDVHRRELGSGTELTIWTVRSSIAVASRLTVVAEWLIHSWSRDVLIVHAMSSAVSGSPSDHFNPSRNVYV